MTKKQFDPTYYKRFCIHSSIEYLYDTLIKKGQEVSFRRSWKRFWKKYPHEQNSREERFNAVINRILREKSDERYCNRIDIKFVSKKVGYGVFAKENIPPYSILDHYAGVLTIDKEIKASNDSAFSFSDYKSYCIDATKAGNWTRFMNHGEEKGQLTNVLAWEFYREEGPRIFFTAGSKGIKKGMQLLYSYGEEYWEKKPFQTF